MQDYCIVTDSSCDLSAKMAEELELSVAPLPFLLDGKPYKNYLDEREVRFTEFYAQLRAGKPAKTSGVNIEDFIEVYESILSQGKDVLYIGFSSGLSLTYQSGFNAAAELREKYPERKILTVDTLSASLGQGLMLYLAAQQKRAGKTIEEVRDYVEAKKLSICHWFTVDDLHFLKRGGRISAATELVGSMLNIKPVMHVDNEGHLIKIETAKGRKGSLKKLMDRMAKTVVNPKEQVVFISHGDCLADAQYLADLIQEHIGVKEIVINFIGPVIGSHSGPGTIALFFVGTER